MTLPGRAPSPPGPRGSAGVSRPLTAHLKKSMAHWFTCRPSLRHRRGSFSSQRHSMNSLLGRSHCEPRWCAAAFSTDELTATCGGAERP